MPRVLGSGCLRYTDTARVPDTPAGGGWFAPPPAGASTRLQVLSGVGEGVDGPARFGAHAAGHEGADVDDPFALLAGDACPVVRVGGVGQVLVLSELVDARVEQVLQPQSLALVGQVVLDGHLLAPVDDVLDHRAGVEVLEVDRKSTRLNSSHVKISYAV